MGEGEDRNERAVGEHTAGVVAEEGAARRVREPRVRHRPRLEPLRRAPGGAAVVGARVRHADAARVVGLPTTMFHGHAMGPVSETIRSMIEPMVQRAALTQSFNESWMLLALLFVLSFCAVSLLRPRSFSLEAYFLRNR